MGFAATFIIGIALIYLLQSICAGPRQVDRCFGAWRMENITALFRRMAGHRIACDYAVSVSIDDDFAAGAR